MWQRQLVILVVIFLSACNDKEAERKDAQQLKPGAETAEPKQAAPGKPQPLKGDVVVDDYEQVYTIFDQLGYTHQRWTEGLRAVPRIYLVSIPQSWRELAPNVPVPKKKQLFFRLITPLLLKSNEAILIDREKLLAHKGDLDAPWLQQLAKKYQLKLTGDSLSPEEFAELKLRVDIIPVSLGLAQSAEESGWGASRFSVEGNSIFGQWDFSGNGIKPEQQRKALGDYGIARFDSLQDSVDAYMLNLNTHGVYRQLRELRAKMRAEGKPIQGWHLAVSLDKYSERGEAYVKTIKSIIDYNKLHDEDEAYLKKMLPIFLIPASTVKNAKS